MAAWSLFSKLKDGLSGADGPPKLETYALHLYGKLPIYKDFISSGFTEEGSKDFRDWLGNGFSRRWSVLDEYKGTEIPLHTFLFALPGGKRSVAGALWGSHDEGGLRQFPFTLFSVVPAGQAGRRPLRRALLPRGLRGAGGLHPAQLPPGTDGRFVLRELPGGADRGAGEAAREDRRRGREGGEGRHPRRLRRVAPRGRPPRPSGRVSSHALKSGLRACAGSRGRGRPAPARKPAAGGAPGPDLADVARRRRASSADRGPSGTLVCRSGGRSRAVLLFRDLRPEDFLLLHPERPTTSSSRRPAAGRLRAPRRSSGRRRARGRGGRRPEPRDFRRAARGLERAPHGLPPARRRRRPEGAGGHTDVGRGPIDLEFAGSDPYLIGRKLPKKGGSKSWLLTIF